MIHSMTGYGKAEYHFANRTTIVEIRSLNSKQLDLTLKVAPLFRDKENEIRQILIPLLIRGKVDVTVYSTDSADDMQQSYTPINSEAFSYYFQQLSALKNQLCPLEQIDVFSAVLRIPDVLKTKADEAVSDEEWEMMKTTINEAVVNYNRFREQEGRALEAMFNDKIEAIRALLSEVEPLEKSRTEKIKQRLLAQLDEWSKETGQEVDKNRFEAEMIYYLEKLDITEEKVRLKNHLDYFQTTMQATEIESVGKKLGFIAQEMGREINTLGSKSNQSEMQVIVVKMKDLLEQIKEQVLNVL